MPYKLDSVKILLVDDLQPFIEVTASVLNIFGFQNIVTARNGQEGFEVFKKEHPDLVITDWQMEPVNGLEMTKLIRTDPQSPDPFVPILVMTGYSSRIRVETARDHGMTEFIVKPFSSKDLYMRIKQIIEKPRQFVDADTFFGPDR
ncbi:MAG: response regulator, partial [Bdellovibrionales bacterium]